jgi:hypothetical protein
MSVLRGRGMGCGEESIDIEGNPEAFPLLLGGDVLGRGLTLYV